MHGRSVSLASHQRVICGQRPWPTNDGLAAAANDRLNLVMTELRTTCARSGLQKDFVALCAAVAVFWICDLVSRGGGLLMVPRARER